MSLLAHTIWGKGSPLLLIHGFTGNRDAWNHFRPLLGDRSGARTRYRSPRSGRRWLPASRLPVNP